MSRDWFAEWLECDGTETLSEFVARVEQMEQTRSAFYDAQRRLSVAFWRDGFPQLSQAGQSALTSQELQAQRFATYLQTAIGQQQRLVHGIGGLGNVLGRLL